MEREEEVEREAITLEETQGGEALRQKTMLLEKDTMALHRVKEEEALLQEPMEEVRRQWKWKTSRKRKMAMARAKEEVEREAMALEMEQEEKALRQKPMLLEKDTMALQRVKEEEALLQEPMEAKELEARALWLRGARSSM